jgi:hypothetical protein
MDVDGRNLQTLQTWSHSGTAVNALTVDCVNVYYALTDGTIGRFPLDGGQTTQLATEQQVSLQMAVDAENLYFLATVSAADGEPGQPPKGFVRSVPIAGGPVRTLADAQGAVGGIAVDATNVYWSNTGDGTVSKIAK